MMYNMYIYIHVSIYVLLEFLASTCKFNDDLYTKHLTKNMSWCNLAHEHTCTHTVYVPIDAHCASADLRVRVYLKK